MWVLNASSQGPRPKGPAALMSDRSRPGAKLQSVFARFAAEIQIVKMEVEARIKAKVVLHQHRFLDRQQHAIQYFAIRWHGTLFGHLTEGILTMRDVATEVRRIVGREIAVEELQGRLRRVSPLIAGNPNQVVCGKPIDNALGEQ